MERNFSIRIDSGWEENANKFRKELGMRIIKTGRRKCLACDHAFDSKDISNVKMCDNCRARMRY